MNLLTSRRHFLKGAAATSAALVVGLDVDGALATTNNVEFIPNPFIKVMADNTLIVITKHFEMGQGTTTGLATLVAEEMDADWAKIKVEFAPSDAGKYKNLLLGSQGTGGSTAIANSYEQYRKAAATARDLLIKAASEEWGTDTDKIVIKNGVITHPSGKKASFGELAERAAKVELTSEPTLKNPDQFKYIGKAKLPRKDSAEKTNGTAIFAFDVKLPNMAYVVIARPPRFGGAVKTFDDSKTRKVKGVLDVKQIPRGIAVYAKNSWAAIKGREALNIEWDFSNAENRSSDQMMSDVKKTLDEDGLIAKNDGDASAALKSASKKISATFEFPFLAHTPMEPLNCVLNYDGKTAELWDGCQFPSLVHPTVAAILGLDVAQVKINTVYAGGSFGRRANATSDYQSEAAMAAKAVEGKWPIKLFWTREDDVKGGYYRPMFVESIEAGIDENGKLTAWHHKLAGKSIFTGTPLESALVKDGIDHASVEGAADMPHAIPNARVDLRNMQTQVPVLWWRSVGHTHTAFAVQVALDMAAKEAGRDPLEFQLELLEKSPRAMATLKLAAEKADWGKPMPKGKGRGIAYHFSFNTHVAQVVEVSADEDGAITVDRVISAVDCGVAVNPDVIEAQVEGSIGYAYSALRDNEITLTDGEVDQGNFPDYEPIRISAMPKIDIHIVSSSEKPTGIGEPATPPFAPAVSNAIFAATGKRVTTMPFSSADIEFA